MEFRILGPLEVWHDGRPVPVAGARQRELLAILLLHAGEVVSTDRLMDALWGERQPAAGATALRVRLSQLRRALGPLRDRVVTRGPGYALLADHDAVDLGRFERMLAEARRSLAAGDPAKALDRAQAALALWRGDPLADFGYAAWAQSAIVRLGELRMAALELRIDAELALGRHAAIAADLQALVDEHPLRERLWAQLMLALYRGGRQAEALAAYRTARERLVEEIGIEPGPELRALESRMLAQDPALAGEPAAVAPAPQRRAVLALPDPPEVEGRVAEIAERLAVRGGHELVVVGLVAGADELSSTARRLAALRDRARGRAVDARVATFVATDPGADAVRLAGELDAAVLVIEAQERGPRAGDVAPEVRTVLSDAVCDVILVAGAASAHASAGAPVLVPFAGHLHDWSAIEVGAWLAGDSPLRLLGARDGGGRDASRLLASASLALQRSTGVAAEPVLVDDGPEGIVAASDGARAIVVGLSERWTREGIGTARTEIVRRAACPVLLVRGGLRPGGLAPPEALTRFTWSGGG